MSTVTVVDSAGAVVESLDVTVTGTMTRTAFDVSDYNGANALNPGLYVVFHDGFTDSIHTSGEDVSVTFLHDSDTVATAEFVFATDQCRCHISKLSGPDTVVANLP